MQAEGKFEQIMGPKTDIKDTRFFLVIKISVWEILD